MSLLPETAIQAITAPDIDCLIVGLSGGLDSTALLHSLAQLTDRPPLKAIHINHGLQAESRCLASALRDHLRRRLGLP